MNTTGQAPTISQPVDSGDDQSVEVEAAPALAPKVERTAAAIVVAGAIPSAPPQAGSWADSSPTSPTQSSILPAASAALSSESESSIAAKTPVGAASTSGSTVVIKPEDVVLEAESMIVSPFTEDRRYRDQLAAGGEALRLYSNATASTTMELPAFDSLIIRAKGTKFLWFAPRMTVAVDGQLAYSTSVSAKSWTDYVVPVSVEAGTHTLSITYTNDFWWKDLRLDKITAVAAIVVVEEDEEVFDSFDGPAGAAPNPGKWTTAEGTGWDIGIENYASGNAVLDGQGHLVLTAQKTDDGYTSGRVETKGEAIFGYGTLTARIMMPSGTGLWPAFFLVGADEDSNPWPGAGEIDVVELVSDPHTRYSSIHGPISGVGDYLQVQIIGESPDLSADFHNYWVTRRENSITVGMDDTVWGTFTPESLPPTAEWVYNKPFYVVLKLAVGGAWAGPPDNSTPFPASMLIDYMNWEPA